MSRGFSLMLNAPTLVRYSSAIRAACANERSCGSARGAISDGRPYRDQQLSLRKAPDTTIAGTRLALTGGRLRGTRPARP
jgi:hypothetical protein